MKLTMQDIEAGRSPAGGWTKATLASWGVPWPPHKGWQRRLLGDEARTRTGPPEPVLIGKTGGPVPEDNEETPPWD